MVGSIKSPPSPSREQPGLFGRLLRRTQSKGERQRATVSTSGAAEYVSLPLLGSHPTEFCNIGRFPDSETSDMHKMQTRTPPTPPTLKKKASFRDRIKSWQKPPSTPLQVLEVIEEPEQQQPEPARFVYQPKHAASDFSRTAVPHGRHGVQLPGWRPSAPRELEAVNEGVPALRNGHPQSRRRTESRPTAGSNIPAHYDAAGRRPSQSSHAQSATSSHRYSTTYGENPFLASSAAAHIPVNPYPVSWNLGTGTQASERHPAMRHDQNQDQMPQQQLPVVVAPPRRRSEPQTDFQRFMAEAEAKERARAERDERIKRSFSQRSHQVALNRVPPNPHVQYASATSGSSSADVSAATTAVAASRNSSRGRAADAQRSSGHFVAVEERVPQSQQQGHRRTHTRNSSWTASYTTGASEEKKAGAITQVYRVDEKPQAEQKGLKRQVSISQRIADYIRPPKQGVSGGGLGDRMGSTNRRRVQTIEE
ncbi:hypothetical protein QBC44DRAFT_329764 [Cladorrhinum sp. PSN332]|nr:hypothetical protein QBC44DRAFT_329764 [Cladorrhinum sp. PSN332]